MMEEHSLARCDFLKLDCEGAEYDILLGLSHHVAKRISQISLEVHTVPGREPAEIKSRLQELGYRLEYRYVWHAWRE